jgi:hypothetical protein
MRHIQEYVAGLEKKINLQFFLPAFSCLTEGQQEPRFIYLDVHIFAAEHTLNDTKLQNQHNAN